MLAKLEITGISAYTFDFVRNLNTSSPDDGESDACDFDRGEEIPDTVDRASAITAYVLLALTFTYVPWCFVYFLYFASKPQYHRLHQRNRLMVSIFGATPLFYAFLVPFRNVYGPAEYPCDVYILMVHITTITTYCANVARLVSLHHRTKLNTEILDLTFSRLQKDDSLWARSRTASAGPIQSENQMETENQTLRGEAVGRGSKSDHAPNNSSFFNATQHSAVNRDRTVSSHHSLTRDDIAGSLALNGRDVLFTSSGDNLNHSSQSKPMLEAVKLNLEEYSYTYCGCNAVRFFQRAFWNVLNWIKPFIIGPMYYITCWKHSPEVPKELRVRYFLASKRFRFLFFLIMSIIQTIALGIFYSKNFAPFEGCTGCGVKRLSPVQLPIILFFLLTAFPSLYFLRIYPDTLGIRKEMLVLIAIFMSIYLFIVPICNRIFGRLEETGEWDFSYITTFGLILGTTYSMPIQVLYAKKAIKIVEANGYNKNEHNESLDKILKSERGTKAFALHLATELSLENLYFYKTSKAWRRKAFHQLEVNTDRGNAYIKEGATFIYEDYFSKDAMFPMNVSNGAVHRIEMAIKGDAITPHLFDECIAEVYYLMSSNSFYPFIHSSYYKAYINDLDAVDSQTHIYDSQL